MPATQRKQLLAEGTRSRALVDKLAIRALDALEDSGDDVVGSILNSWGKLGYQ